MISTILANTALGRFIQNRRDRRYIREHLGYHRSAARSEAASQAIRESAPDADPDEITRRFQEIIGPTRAASPTASTPGTTDASPSSTSI